MTIVRVQGNARGTSATSTVSVTLASTPTVGNILIATIGSFGDVWGSGTFPVTVSSITQTSVTWTKQMNKSYVIATNYFLNTEIWFGVVTAGASASVSVTLSGNANGGSVTDICEYSGVASSSMLDKTASASGGNSSSTAAVTGTTASTTMANELLIGAISCISVTQSTPTNSFSLLDGALYSSCSLAYLENIVSSTGTYSSGTTMSAQWQYYAGCIATFKAAVVVSGQQLFTLINEMNY